MRAIRIHGKDDMRVEDVPTPEPGTGQVRLRMAFAGVCGSDLHYFYEGANGAFRVAEPLVPGHEVSGYVDEDPAGRLAPGTPVTLHPATFGQCAPGLENHPHLWPGGAYLGSASTWPHTQGGMSEFLVVEASMVRVLPAGLSVRDAALAEPLAVALHAINVTGGVDGARVLVSGSGPIGLLLAAGALASGAASAACSDVLNGPLQRARDLGVQATYRIGVDEIPDEAFDVVFECSGVPAAVSSSVRAVRRAGVIAQVGMMSAGPKPIELATLISKEAQLRGSFRFRDEIDAALDLLARNPGIGQVITHEVPVEDVHAAFATARDSEASGKVLVQLWGAES